MSKFFKYVFFSAILCDCLARRSVFFPIVNSVNFNNKNAADTFKATLPSIPIYYSFKLAYNIFIHSMFGFFKLNQKKISDFNL